MFLFGDSLLCDRGRVKHVSYSILWDGGGMVALICRGLNLRGQHQTEWTPQSESKWILLSER
jgi:hypothetical protein